MDTFLIKATQLILAFAILVIIHEFGHFLFARMFGVKVEKFYIFFNPFTSLFKWKPRRHVGSLKKMRFFNDRGREEYEGCRALAEAESEYLEAEKELKSLDKQGGIFSSIFGGEKRSDDVLARTEARERVANAKAELDKQLKLQAERDAREFDEQKGESRWKRFWKHTEYGVGWLPLGGYCKISGMIDESMDTAQMRTEPKPWEFRSKPAWQRLLIMIAGVLFNFLLAILIYAGIVYATGEKYVTFDKAEMGMAYSEAAHNIGFRDGDIPLAADGKRLDSPADARMEMIQAKEVSVVRNGKDTVKIAIPENFIFRLDEEAKKGDQLINFMTYRIPVEITQVTAGGGADKAGIKVGDRIAAVDTTATPSIIEFFPTLAKYPNKRVNLTVLRRRGESGEKEIAWNKAAIDTLSVAVDLSESAKMGVGLEVDPAAFFPYEEKHYSIFSAVPRGIEMGTDKLTGYAKSMKLVFTKEGAKSVGGFGAIGSIFPEKWDWIAFWNIAAFLSVALAFMNILPIPALDGGHVMFLLYEVIFRRKPSEKFMEYAQLTGMILLILLLVYANGMDIVRLFQK